MTPLLKALVTTAVCGCLTLQAQADGNTPLLMEGKTTLYQRVLTIPGCKIMVTPEDVQEVPAFTQYYVYNKTAKSYEVGATADGRRDGWLSRDCVVPWKQQVGLMFTNPAPRNRTLIFDSEEALDNIIDADDDNVSFRYLNKKVQNGEKTDHIISIEPKEAIDWQKNFYLLPILNSAETMFPDGSYTWKHEIASVVAKDAVNQADKNEPGLMELTGHEPTIVGFTSAVVFVIDSSISMQPYIDRTRQAIRTIYRSIEAENLNDSVQFGIIAFRGDSSMVPGLEYTAKIFLRPGEAKNAHEFDAKVAELKQARVSSKQFDEDAYAGVSLALRSIDWSNYGGRYIVLITDAGAIDPQDPQSATGLDARALRLDAEHYGAAIYTLHLRTPSGKRNHNHLSAEQQYKELSFNSAVNTSLYYPVDGGSLQTFGNVVDQLNTSLTEQVRLASQGKLSAGSALNATAPQRHATRASMPKPAETVSEKVAEDSHKLGLAMQLAWLGSVKGTKSPEFLRGWLADRDIENHNMVTCTPVVLVNRNQLSDLYTLVTNVLRAGISGQLSSEDMFDQLQSLAAQMGRDPSQLSQASTIAQMGIMGELLDDLPYKSRIASLTPDDWFNAGAQEQEEMIRDLEDMQHYLQECSSDIDRWIKLNDRADDTEAVYPVPLDALP